MLVRGNGFRGSRACLVSTVFVCAESEMLTLDSYRNGSGVCLLLGLYRRFVGCWLDRKLSAVHLRRRWTVYIVQSVNMIFSFARSIRLQRCSTIGDRLRRQSTVVHLDLIIAPAASGVMVPYSCIHRALHSFIVFFRYRPED